MTMSRLVVAKYITTNEALELLESWKQKVCTATLLRWVKKYKLGYQLMPGGPWKIDYKKLAKFVEKNGGE